MSIMFVTNFIKLVTINFIKLIIINCMESITFCHYQFGSLLISMLVVIIYHNVSIMNFILNLFLSCSNLVVYRWPYQSTPSNKCRLHLIE
jgi:hypothetical protein